MHKQTFFFSIFSLLLVFALAGCQSMAGSTSQPAAAQTSAVQAKLAAGTLMLEGTGQAVTAEQAADLLPLWKAVKSLSKSSTTSAVEMQALYDQITETMTADQVQAIKGMSLSQDDMASLMSKYGSQRAPSTASTGSTGSSSGRSSSAGSSSSSGSTSSSSSSGQPGGPGGDMGGGMPPDGGGMMGGGSDLGALTGGQPSAQTTQTSTQNAAKNARTSAQANSNLMFVDTLITLLQQRVDA
jgi:hypothetical protein